MHAVILVYHIEDLRLKYFETTVPELTDLIISISGI
jgi:hypothetical protein